MATHSSTQPDPKLFVEVNQRQGVVNIDHFLLAQDSFKEGKSYSSINVCRSMFSETLSLAPSGLSEVENIL